MNTDPSTLAAAAEMLALGRPLSPDALQVVVEALRALAASSVAGIATSRRGQRDSLLRTIRRRHFPGLSTNAAGTAITESVRRYEAAGWRFDRRLHDCPHPVGSLTADLHRLLRLGTDLPGRRQMHSILS